MSIVILLFGCVTNNFDSKSFNSVEKYLGNGKYYAVIMLSKRIATLSSSNGKSN